MEEILLWIMLACLLLYFFKIIRGRTIWDKLVALNLVSTKSIAIIIIFAFMHQKTYVLDFAIIYALFGFIGTIFLSFFLSKQKVEAK